MEAALFKPISRRNGLKDKSSLLHQELHEFSSLAGFLHDGFLQFLTYRLPLYPVAPDVICPPAPFQYYVEK